jgi:hypothetical protein
MVRRRGEADVLVTLIRKGDSENFFVTVWLRKVVMKEVLGEMMMFRKDGS